MPARTSHRLAAADVERCGEIDLRGRDAIVDQHVLAERVHRGAARIRMRAPTRTERDARHAIGGEMHGVVRERVNSQYVNAGSWSAARIAATIKENRTSDPPHVARKES